MSTVQGSVCSSPEFNPEQLWIQSLTVLGFKQSILCLSGICEAAINIALKSIENLLIGCKKRETQILIKSCVYLFFRLDSSRNISGGGGDAQGRTPHIYLIIFPNSAVYFFKFSVRN
jgi:hypothetical protein